MILTFEEIKKTSEKLRLEGKIIVFTNGCFDLLHLGHLYYLQEAKKLGDVLVVGLNSDSSVKRLKGENRPIFNQEHRSSILDALKPIDYVVIFEEDTPLELIKIVQPNILVKGGDYSIDNVVGAEFVQSYGGKVIIIPYLEGFSTTEILKRIAKKFE
ncbi:MAG: D-glycero-beta-D-manno-heptose 1-phosphate adenylyltransferase [Ignavibacteria bacterium]|nr:D-glycero-beta-D-manno-heptose 1-phosphate adenylyltransferase [Ignavibacteria bacterium]